MPTSSHQYETDLSSRYDRLASKRNAVLERARAAAALTIPSLLPPEGHTEGQELDSPFQSMGARAVNTLSAKTLLALFPPNTSFFKLNPDAEVASQIEETEGEEEMAEVRNKLSKIETTAVQFLEQTTIRAVMSQSIKHLIVTGNITVEVDQDAQQRAFKLDQYVTERDPQGNVIDLIIKETFSPEVLDQDLLEKLFNEQERREFQDKPESTIDAYTRQQLVKGRYVVHQVINKKVVPGSEGSYPADAPRFIVLRWTAVTGEEYGRGMIDEYFGDFHALNELSRDILLGSAEAAKIVYLLRKGSPLRLKDLQGAKSGDILYGDPDDVATVGLDKFADFNVTLQQISNLKAELADAFLMHSSVQRDAERVTAEEIRFLAQELEDSLGGVYSVLAQELQVPLTKRVLKILQKKGKIPPLPEDTIQIGITTGLEALGRGHAVNKLLTLIGQAVEVIGIEEVNRRLDVGVFLKELQTGMGVPISGLFLEEDAVQENDQSTRMMNAMEAAAPGVAAQMVKQQGGQ